MIRGGNRRMPAAATAGHHTRLRTFTSPTGAALRRGEHQRLPGPPGHQDRQALQDIRRYRHDPVGLPRLRVLAQALTRHHVDDGDLPAQPVHPVTMEPGQLARPQARLPSPASVRQRGPITPAGS